jgi:hypothetical protein
MRRPLVGGSRRRPASNDASGNRPWVSASIRSITSTHASSVWVLPSTAQAKILPGFASLSFGHMPFITGRTSIASLGVCALCALSRLPRLALQEIPCLGILAQADGKLLRVRGLCLVPQRMQQVPGH